MGMMIDEALHSALREGWHLRNLIYLNPEWQVNLCDGEYCLSATGDTIDEALANAYEKTFDESKWLGRLASLPKLASMRSPEAITLGNNLLSTLGLLKPQAPVRRI
jgi:hypothetical protein